MNIVVAGYGKVGKAIVSLLVKENHNVAVIDNNAEHIEEAQDDFDIMCVFGNGATRSAQMAANVPEADIVIAVTGVDEVNLLCCVIAKKFGAKKTIARMRNPEYMDEVNMIRDVIGIDLLINPELSVAREIFSVLRFPGLLNIEKFAKGRVELAELSLSPNSPLAGLSLNEVWSRYHVKVLICAVRRDGEVYIPNGDFVLQANDRIGFSAEPDQALLFLKNADIPVHPPKNVIIVGGGRITYFLTQMLQYIHVNPIIIENNPEICRGLSEAFPRSVVINGDGADRDLLHEEGIRTADAFIANTGTDEVNALLSIYATSQNVPKVVTKVSRISIVDLLGESTIGSVISPKDINANYVVSYVRAMENSGSSNSVETLYRIVNGEVEALEFIVKENDPKIVGVSLKELNIKPDILVCAIIRRNLVKIPNGKDCFMVGDHVIVVTKQQQLNDLRNILA